MHAPQIILLVLWAIGLTQSIRDHGQARKPENAWAGIVAMAINAALLWWGGFWKG
jgi:hypothetical protein